MPEAIANCVRDSGIVVRESGIGECVRVVPGLRFTLRPVAFCLDSLSPRTMNQSSILSFAAGCECADAKMSSVVEGVPNGLMRRSVPDFQRIVNIEDWRA